MTDQDITIAMAEFDGYVRKNGHEYIRPDGTDCLIYDLPDYLIDLNAVHEVEKKFWDGDSNEDQWEQYTKWLDIICEREENCSIRASALQRCEAVLRTIGKWKN